ncbi:MAG TPA: hypothetical protein VHJ76_06590, partial [Actinomycetota bacterium]|nr:hypothetical protein [Actinomycetota bacterium]
HDRVTGGGGDDLICLGRGSDKAQAGRGRDRVRGAQGGDEVRGGDGNDLLDGGDHDDQLHGNAGNDRLLLGAAARGFAFAFGGLGRDVVTATAESKAYLYGNKGDDRLHGVDVFHLLDGGAGNDRIEGGIASFETSRVGVAVDLVDGEASGAGDDVLVDVVGASGSLYDDTVAGGPEDDWISGRDGDDILSGGDGLDDVFGGAGADRIAGDAGDDHLWEADDDCALRPCEMDESADQYDGGGGTDRLLYAGYRNGVTADLGEGSGPAGDRVSGIEGLVGSSYDDLLSGNDGDNFIDGGPGSDTLDGRGGTDTCRNGESQVACEG